MKIGDFVEDLDFFNDEKLPTIEDMIHLNKLDHKHSAVSQLATFSFGVTNKKFLSFNEKELGMIGSSNFDRE